MNSGFAVLATILSAIIGLAIISVLVSQYSQTSGIVTASAQGFGYIIQQAVAPVTGGGAQLGSSLGSNVGLGTNLGNSLGMSLA